MRRDAVDFPRRATGPIGAACCPVRITVALLLKIHFPSPSLFNGAVQVELAPGYRLRAGVGRGEGGPAREVGGELHMRASLSRSH
jgi:hypothetical protein